MSIEVFFGGLMLICLKGQQDCPVGNLGNTAWVVKADGATNPCGWPSQEKTEKLVLQFPTAKFFEASGSLKAKCNPAGMPNGIITECILPYQNAYPDLCLIPDSPATTQQLDSSLEQMPRLAEIDRRFIKLNATWLENTDWVPARIHFPLGVIGAGPKWPDPKTPTQWSRSDGSKDGTLPRALSDKLSTTYQGATELKITTCNGSTLIKLNLKPLVTAGEITLLNRAAADISPDVVDDKYDNLAYLLWYYRLGEWDTNDGKCPYYDENNRDAVLLRCTRVNHTYCSRTVGGAADTTHWPPMLGNSY
jgi:hypothetical protein